MATVIDATRDLLLRLPPGAVKQLIFTSEDDAKSTTERGKTSRTRLYRAMLQRFSKTSGFKFKETKKGDTTLFTITKQ